MESRTQYAGALTPESPGLVEVSPQPDRYSMERVDGPNGEQVIYTTRRMAKKRTFSQVTSDSRAHKCIALSPEEINATRLAEFDAALDMMGTSDDMHGDQEPTTPAYRSAELAEMDAALDELNQELADQPADQSLELAELDAALDDLDRMDDEEWAKRARSMDEAHWTDEPDWEGLADTLDNQIPPQLANLTINEPVDPLESPIGEPVSLSPQPLTPPSAFVELPQTHQRLSPLERWERDLPEVTAGDGVFTAHLEVVYWKLLAALREPESTFLFRDFAGHFAEFLDRFGPGGYDSPRAPRSLSWVVKMILPWTNIDDDASLGRINVYEEVNCWIRNLCWYLGARNDKLLFTDGIWDDCVEHVASKNPDISLTAYRTVKSIIRSTSIDEGLVFKVLVMRNICFDYDSPEMCFFRNHHVKLMRYLLEGLGHTELRNTSEQTIDLVHAVNRELEFMYLRESDSVIKDEITECLNFAEDVCHQLEEVVHRRVPEAKSLTKLRKSIDFSHWLWRKPGETSRFVPGTTTAASRQTSPDRYTVADEMASFVLAPENSRARNTPVDAPATPKPGKFHRFKAKIRAFFSRKPVPMPEDADMPTPVVDFGATWSPPARDSLCGQGRDVFGSTI